jgi:DNA topoisomerase-2
VPSYKGFTGTISQIEPSKYAVYGTISRLDDHQVEITELPVRSWTQTYKEKVVEVMLHGTDKVQPGIIDCMEYHTDTTVRFVLNLTKETAAECEKVGYHKKFKLEGSVTTSNLVLFDHNGCLRKYSHVHEILHEFFSVRLEMYGKRKSWLEGQLAAESKKLNNQARYIDEVLERKINISGKLKDVVSLLKERKYDSDPVKSWKEKVGAKVDSDKDEDSDEEADKLLKAHWPDYDYLLGTTTRQFTEEKRDELLRKKKAKSEELRILQGNTPSDLWSEDLDHFMIELEKLEQKEKEALEMNVSPTLSQGKKGSKGKRPGKARQRPKLTSLGVVAESLPQATPEDVIPPIIPKFSDKKEKTSKRGKKESPGENEKANEDKGQRSLKDFFALDVEQDDKDDTEKKQTEKSSKQGSLPCQETDALKLACPAKRGKSKLKPKPTDSIDDVMDVKESESDTCEPKPPRAAPPRRAAAAGTKRYTYETSDEDSEDDKDDTEKKQTEKSSKQASLPSQETDPPMLACPIKRGRSKLKPKIIDSIEDVVDSASDKSGSDIGEPKPKRIAPPRRVAAAGTKRYTCEISDEASEQSEDDTTGDSDNDFAYVKPLKKRLSPMEAVKEKPAEGKGSKKRLVSVKATGKQPPKEKETSKQVKLRKQPTVTEVLSNAQNRKRKAKEPVFVIESDEDEEASFDRIIDSQSKRNQNTKARKGGSTKIETDEDDDHGDEDFAADDDDDDEDDEDFTL